MVARPIIVGERAKVVLVVKQGETFRVDLRCRDENDALVDFTAYQAEFKAVHRDTTITLGSAVLIDDSSDGDADAGMLHIVLQPDDTRSAPLGRQMLWAVQVVSPDGDETIVVSGVIDGQQGLDNNDD